MRTPSPTLLYPMWSPHSDEVPGPAWFPLKLAEAVPPPPPAHQDNMLGAAEVYTTGGLGVPGGSGGATS